MAKVISPSHLLFMFLSYKLLKFTVSKIWPPPNKNDQDPPLDQPPPNKNDQVPPVKHSASISSSRSLKYDVFLSFRREDTSKIFVDHLYSALTQQQIVVYKHDETLPRDESDGPSLFSAIEESKIALIILSKNYADSSWCLEELVHIMKCSNEIGLFVMPIYYDVEPSEVRNQKGDFGEVFAKQEVEHTTMADSWRRALTHVGNLSGWEPRIIADREPKVTKDIVDTILDRLLTMYSDVDEDLVGMTNRLQDLKSQLDLKSDGVRMVGICGLGGSGKTTLASSLYLEISSDFEGHHIVQNIREKLTKDGLEKLQESIILACSKREVRVQNVEQGKHMISCILCSRKVLIILDDVNDRHQLDALAGSHSWFGNGSRIIITTRDEHLLITHKVDVICQVRLLSGDEALQLFNKHAYNEKKPVEDYEELSSRVVSYAAGLPLALKVLGRFLYGKDKSGWINALDQLNGSSGLDKLQDNADLEVIEKLKISYNGLQRIEQELFLDIACFWRWRSTNDAMEIFEACGYYPRIGIKVLRQKSLIAIVDGRFTMHDLVQEMGYYIVRGEHPHNPKKHSRVWKHEEIRNMCLGDATMENYEIEAIKYHGHDHSSHFYKTVLNMKALRWLCVTLDDEDGDEDSEGPDFLSKELRCIYWEKYLKSPFPESFQPTKLVVLELSKCGQKTLWKDCKYLPNLKVLRLEEMKKLLSTPDFNGLPFLSKLTLSYCDELEEIHPSLGQHSRLEYVTISRCLKIRLFPTIIGMKEIKALKIEFCPAMLKFPEIQTNMEMLEELSFQSVGIKDLPSSIGDLSNLQELNLSRNAFTQIDFSLSQLTRLKFLNLSNCRKLLDLPELPSNLTTLKADYCNSLRTLGDFNKRCKWLCQVSLMGGSIINNGGILLQSMLQGKAVENHSMHLQLQGLEVAKGFTPRLRDGSRFSLQLPKNWRNDFCGFLMCAVWTTKYYWSSSVRINLKLVPDSQHNVLWEESDSNSAYKSTLVWYVSFGSLKDTSWWKQTHKSIFFDIEDKHKECSGFGVRLVGKRSKSDHPTDISTDFSHDTSNYTHNFKIEGDSESALTIVLKSLLTTEAS